MSPEVHALNGTAVLLVSLVLFIWTVVAWRRGLSTSRAMTAGLIVATALLTIQVLLGMDLFLRGGRPTTRPLAEIVHIGGPVIALIVALGILAGDTQRTPARYAIAMAVVFLAGLTSYLIGELA